MPRRSSPQPSENFAGEFRRAHRIHDREPAGRYGRAGYGYPDGYRGGYAERQSYAAPRGRLYPPEPRAPLRSLSPESEARHLRAYRDRDLARAVDFALYNSIGPDADHIAVYADDAVITLEGRVSHPGAAREALETAWLIPGVRRVRNALSWRR